MLRPDDIVVDAGHQLTGLALGEEAERLSLEVIEDGAAQIEDDALADLGADVPLEHADEPVEQGHEHHAGGQQVQLAEVAVRQRIIDQGPHEERRNQCQAGDCQDGQQHQCDAATVRLCVGGHAAQHRPIDA